MTRRVKRVNGLTIRDNSKTRPPRHRWLPVADAWLPEIGEAVGVAARIRWAELGAAQRRMWLVRAGLLMALALALVLHPSSAVRDVVVWSSFLFVLIHDRKDIFSRKPDALSLAILIYGVLVAASVAYSVHRRWSFREAEKFFVVLAMVFAAWRLFRNRSFLFGFLQLLVFASLIVCIYDVVIYLRGLGEEWQWGERWVFGPYHGHPNTASAILMLLLPIAAYLLSASRNVWLKAVHGCFIALSLFLMYVTASRTAQLSLAGMVLCGAAVVRPRKRKVLSLVVVGSLFALVYLNLRLLNPRFLDETAKTLTFRVENWQNVGKLVSEKPVFGYGFGKKNYQAVYHSRFRGSPIPYEHAHSILLQTAFETGAVGLLTIFWLWAATILRLLRGYAASRGPLAGFHASVLTSFLGVSIYCLAEVPDGLLRSLLWLLIAISGAITGQVKDSRNSPRLPTRGQMQES